MQFLLNDVTKSYISSFLQQLFNKLEQEEIDYAVARDYKSLPESLDGRDLDIHVMKGDLERACKIVETVASLYSAIVLKIKQENAIFLLVIHSQIPFWGLRIDLALPNSHTWRGCPYIDLTGAMERKISEKGMNRFRDEDIFFMQLCRELVGPLYLRQKYHVPIQNLYSADKKKFENELTKVFGKRYSDRLLEIIRTGNFNNIEDICKRLRLVVMSRCLLSTPLKTTKGVIQYISWRCREYLKPNGIMVTVMGPDASNNGTLIEAIKKDIYTMIQCRVRTYHGRPHLLSGIGSLFLGQAEDGFPVPNPQETKHSGIIISTLHLAYNTLDYVLGYWFKLRHFLGRKYIAVIFDGYFYDYLMDPIRFGLSLPKWIIRIFSAVVPKPDICFILSADPKTLGERNRDLSIGVIDRRNRENFGFVDYVKNPVWIDTGGSIEKAYGEMLITILRVLELRLNENKA